MNNRSEEIPEPWAKLIDNLSSPFLIVREQAYTRLNRYPQPPLSILLIALSRQHNSWRRSRIVQILPTLVAWWLAELFYGKYDYPYIFLCISAAALVFMAHRLRWPPKAYQTILQMVAEREDVHAINIVIDGLVRGDLATRPKVSAALQEMLLGIGQKDAELISYRSRQILYAELHGSDPWLIRAILLTLPFFDDGGALAGLESIVNRQRFDSSATDVVALARKLLPSVREQAARNLTGATLLRSSQASQHHSQTALRPAAEPRMRDDLLKPSETENVVTK